MPGFGLVLMNMMTLIRAYSVELLSADMNYVKSPPIRRTGRTASQSASGLTLGRIQDHNHTLELNMQVN